MEEKAHSVVDEDEASSHLRSISEVRCYQVFASDGCAGRINHFEIDDEGWGIRYLIVDGCGSIAEKLAVIASAWVKSIKWSDKTITVDVRREQIEKSPEFDPAQEIERGFEQGLHDHYRRPVYW